MNRVRPQLTSTTFDGRDSPTKTLSNPSPKPKSIHCEPQSEPQYFVKSYNTFPEGKATFSTPFCCRTNCCWQANGLQVHSNQDWSWLQTSQTDFKRFPFSNFTYCLTLFSKFFSSFPHGTCSLSVSRQYLALGEIYHPIKAAFPNNLTRWSRITKDQCSSQRRDSHPPWCPIPRNLFTRLVWITTLKFTIRSG